jgi:SAM-dependent methyltransferase
VLIVAANGGMAVTLYKPYLLNEPAISEVDDYLHNLMIEYNELKYSPEERTAIKNAMLYRLIDNRSPRFFYYHMNPLFLKAAKALFQDNEHPFIVDLGCGTGAATIFFGLLGARVVGVDVDRHIIGACNKRKELYEKEFGVLDISFICADAFELDFSELGTYDGIYSLFAFNSIQPSSQLVPSIIQPLRKKGRIVISDGNRDSVLKKFSRQHHVLKPMEMKRAFENNSCYVLYVEFGCMLPPPLAQIDSFYRLGHKFEYRFRRSSIMRRMGVSYTILAEKS